MQPHGGVLLADTNRCLFDKNYKYKSIYHLLEEKHGFVMKCSELDGEITVYVHKDSNIHVVIVHRPLCLSSDSRRFIKMVWRTLRGLSMTVLSHVSREIRGLAPLKKDDELENPLLAMYVFQITTIGLHQHPRVAAVFYRHLISPPTTNAMTATRVASTAHDKSAAVSVSVRRPKSARVPATGATRENDNTIMVRARSIISQTPSPSPTDMLCLYQRLDRLFTEGDTTKTLVSYRWNSLLSNHCLPGSELKKKLTAVRVERATNMGNRTEGREVVQPDGIHVNNDEMDQIIRVHGPKGEGEQGSSFWVWSGKHEDTDKPPDGSRSMCGRFAFPGDYPCYREVTETSVKGRFKLDKTPKGKTNQVKATRYPHLQLQRIRIKGFNGGTIVPTATERRTGCKKLLVGWVLVYINYPIGGVASKKRTARPVLRAAKKSKK